MTEPASAVVPVAATKAAWGGKGLFDLCFDITVHCQRKSGQDCKHDRNLGAGADRPWSGAAYWLGAYA